MDTELLLLSEVSFEIKRLRKDNDIMRARLEMFDDMMLLFKTRPSDTGVSMSPDILYQIDKHIASKKDSK